MKRVLIIHVQSNANWIGGVYYSKNICYMLLQNERIVKQYQITILCNEEIRSEFECFGQAVRIISFSSKSYVWNLIYHTIPFSYMVKIIYNPLRSLLKKIPLRLVYWIPDFQHRHFPRYFTSNELQARDLEYEQTAKNNYQIILSSENALNDFKEYYQISEQRTYVLHFVSYIEEYIHASQEEAVRAVLDKYKLERKAYILIANQFWQHKNHKVVFEMIALAKKQQELPEYQFVFTGVMSDYRNPEHILELQNIIEQNHIEDKIQLLGFIDRQEQIMLMKESLLLIQPSLFEGWGTVVEDGKVLDKTMLLSDIPLHREQMNSKCILFEAANPADLLEKLKRTVQDILPDDTDAGISDMRLRAREYAKTFEKLFSEG